MPGWIGADGKMHGFEHSNGYPMFASVPYEHGVARGTLQGAAAWIFSGLNEDVGTTEEILAPAGGVYPYLAEPAKFNVVSTSIEDTDVGTSGEGAFDIFITGLDADFNVQTEVLPLEGQTPVQTAKTYSRVSRATNVFAGTAGTNVGTITIKDLTNTNTHLHIAPGIGQSKCAVYTVPLGKNYIVVGGEASSASQKGSRVGVYIRPFGQAWRNVYNVSLFASAHNIQLPTPLVVPAKSDIEIRAKALQTGDSVTAAIYGWTETT